MARLGPRLRRVPDGGPLVAGIELAAGAVRVVTGRRDDDGRLRVASFGSRTLPTGAVAAGLVVDRRAVETAVTGLLAEAERVGRATRVVLALDGDDVRTFHLTTTFERTTVGAPITASEMTRAEGQAAADLAVQARVAASADLALRGIATVQARDDPAGYLLDGRPLASLVGFQGRLVDVRADVTLMPLVMSGAALAVFAGRAASLACGAHALGRLLAGSGVADTGVVRLGADLTAVAVVRSGEVISTRSFSLGRGQLSARAQDEDDPWIWAAAVLEALGDSETPERWLLAGAGEGQLSSALADAASERRGSAVDVAPLRAALVTRIITETPLAVEDLVAAGAAALAAEVYR